MAKCTVQYVSGVDLQANVVKCGGCGGEHDYAILRRFTVYSDEFYIFCPTSLTNVVKFEIVGSGGSAPRPAPSLCSCHTCSPED